MFHGSNVLTKARLENLRFGGIARIEISVAGVATTRVATTRVGGTSTSGRGL